jgi:hypothetical protein
LFSILLARELDDDKYGTFLLGLRDAEFAGKKCCIQGPHLPSIRLGRVVCSIPTYLLLILISLG